MNKPDRFNLSRFRSAQQAIFPTALDELRAGSKRSHWMWFVFPQLRGLGHSPTAHIYGISSIDEARAYLADSILGERLQLVTAATLAVEGSSASDIFGSPDDLKFHSSMTLFSVADGGANSLFRSALDRFFAGQADAKTLELLGR